MFVPFFKTRDNLLFFLHLVLSSDLLTRDIFIVFGFRFSPRIYVSVNYFILKDHLDNDVKNTEVCKNLDMSQNLHNLQGCIPIREMG